jgi:hypothetical protein
MLNCPLNRLFIHVLSTPNTQGMSNDKVKNISAQTLHIFLRLLTCLLGELVNHTDAYFLLVVGVENYEVKYSHYQESLLWKEVFYLIATVKAGMLPQLIDKPGYFLHLLFTGFINLSIFDLELAPHKIKLVEHLERHLKLRKLVQA